MNILEKRCLTLKTQIEKTITESKYLDSKSNIKKSKDGHAALGSFIRSKIPINNIHEAIKEVFIEKYNVPSNLIYPPLNSTKPELKIVGRIKDKMQDICIIPDEEYNKEQEIVKTYLGDKQDEFGINFVKHTLIINIRSQIVSIAKNTDTILERTFAEPINLNLRNENIILGEFFLLPVKEVDASSTKNNKVMYQQLSPTIIEKYINFFTAMRDKENKTTQEKLISYSECCLILVDFSKSVPKIYKNTSELIDDKIVTENFKQTVDDLYFYKVIDNLYQKYLRIKNT